MNNIGWGFAKRFTGGETFRHNTHSNKLIIQLVKYVFKCTALAHTFAS